VYFASDRDARGRMNLYSLDLATKQTKALTDFAEFDVKFPSMGDAAIVFEKRRLDYKLDLASEKVEKVPVTIAEDFDAAASRSSTSATP